MKMVQCGNGHFYDEEKNSTCPYCNMSDDGGKTMAYPSSSSALDRTVPLGNLQAVNNIGVTSSLDEGKTVAIYSKKNNSAIDPVCGWLIVIKGPEKGRSFPIHSENNFIGRADEMDISLSKDNTVSRERHAIISYDSRDKVFFLTPGEGRSIVRLNDSSIFQTAKLKEFDRIELGETLLIFRSLCGEEFDWSTV